jgi:rubrerythrin
MWFQLIWLKRKNLKEYLNMKIPTKRWLKAMIRDEKEASKIYKQYGFPSLAKDEARHKRVLTAKLKKVI